MSTFHDLPDDASVAALAGHDLVFLFKHSPRCSISTHAHGQVERFLASRPGVPVYRVDVVRQRALSRRLAEEAGIEHESPQVILFVRGNPRWHASHFDVTEERLAGALSGLGNVEKPL